MSVTSITTTGAIFSPELSGATGAVTIAAPKALDTTSVAQTKSGNLKVNTLTAVDALISDGTLTVTGAITGGNLGLSGSFTAETVSTPTTNGVLGIYNVKDFGATGNGSTDDTTALQATITAASATNGSVFFPPGTYKITSTLNATQATHLVGSSGGGAEITGSVSPLISATGLSSSAFTNFTMTHLTLYGTSTNVLLDLAAPSFPPPTTGATCQITNCNFIGQSTSGITLG